MNEKRSYELSPENTCSTKKVKTNYDEDLNELDSYEIIWFQKDGEDPINICRLRMISDSIKYFNEMECLRESIENIISLLNVNTFSLVVSGEFDTKFLSQISHVKQICSIHWLITRNSTTCKEFVNNEKVKIYDDIYPLLKALSKNIQQSLKRIAIHDIFDIIGNQTESQTTTNDIESWWPKLIHILVHLPYPPDCFRRFIVQMKERYAKNPFELRNIDELEKNYQSTLSKNPIQEYTKDTFLYRSTNHALRQKNIKTAFLFGFFLRDLYEQLKIEHEKFLRGLTNEVELTVYRGQIMSKDEIKKLKTSTENLVTNSFLSTSRNAQMSSIYLGTSNPDDDEQSILFEIKLKKSVKCLPYADISAISWFPSESEVLLMPSLEFQLVDGSFRYDNERKFWLAKLELVSDTIEKADDKLFDNFTQRRKMRYYIELLTETLTEFCGVTESLIETVFSELIESFPEEKWMNGVKSSCLAKYNIDHNFDSITGMKHWNEAIDYWTPFQDDDELNAAISLGHIYFDMGRVYHHHLRQVREAEETNNQAINYFLKALDKGVTILEEIDIYESIYEMHAEMVVIVSVLNGNREREKELETMVVKYQHLHLLSLLKHYPIDDERVSMVAEQLSRFYNSLEMYNEDLSLWKDLFDRYESADKPVDSEKMVEILKRIISNHLVHKKDLIGVQIYLEKLDEYTGEEKEDEASDDFLIDYRQSDEIDYPTNDSPVELRRWSTDN